VRAGEGASGLANKNRGERNARLAKEWHENDRRLRSLVFVRARVGASQSQLATIELLAQERTQAETCVATLKSSSDKAAAATGRLTYGAAKSQAEGVIAGLTVALVQGGQPDALPMVLTSLKKAGAGLQEVCDAALKSASAAGGTKGLVEDILKAPIEPIVNAISAGVSALWTGHVEKDKLADDQRTA
jgi:hypothetical protein